MDSVPLTDALRETLVLFDSPEPRTTTEVADALDLGRRSAYDRLDRLVDAGRLETKTVGANGRVWWQPSGPHADAIQLEQPARRLERQRDDPESEPEEVFDRIADAVFGLDAEGRLTYLNDRAETVLDVDRAAAIGRDVRETVPLTERFEAALERARDQRTPVSIEDDRAPLDGWSDVTVYPSETGVSVYVRDSSERTARERQIDEYRRWAQTLVENYPSGAVAVVDTDLRYVTFGGTVEGEADVSSADLEGEPLREALPDRLADVVVSGYEAALDGEQTTFEETIDDRVYEFHFHPVRDESGDVFAATAISQEITEREARERELQDRVRQQEVVAELGQRALAEQDLGQVMADATELVAETLDTEYCKVLELRPDDDELLLREGVGWDDGIVGTATVSAVEADSQAAYTLATEQPVIVRELTTEPRFSGPALLTDHDVESGISTIIGSPAEPWGILGTHDTTTREFSEHDAAFVQSVANILATAVEHHRRERTLRRQRSQLAALNDLNAVVWGMTGAMFDQSSRGDIETTVCDGLTQVPAYDAAWVAAVDHGTETISPRTATGFAVDLDAMPLAAADDAPAAQRVLERAARTGEMQTTSAPVEAVGLPVAAADADAGVRSVAAIPIVHEGTTYGLLGVLSAREGAFTGAERGVLDQLGAVVGHAIAAAERERVLVSDEVTEIVFTVPDYLETIGVTGPTDGTFTVDRLIPVGDESFLGYGTADPDAVETVLAMCECHPDIDEVTVFDRDADPVRFELRTSAPLQSELSAQGGSVHGVRVDDGDLRMTIHLPPSVTVRRFTDAVERLYPDADLMTRRQVTREPQSVESARELTDELTERQRTALEVAVYAGYFASPRGASGETIADSLDVAPSTFHHHLREAQRKVFESVVGAPTVSTDRP